MPKLIRVLDNLDDVPENAKEFYTEKNGKFVLDVDGDDDTSALKRAKDREAAEARKWKAKAEEQFSRIEELESEMAELSSKGAKPADLEALKAKHAKDLKEANDKFAKLTNGVTTQLIKSTSESLAAEISNVPSVMAKVIKDRLKVDIEDGLPVIRILDSDGNVSANSMKELRQELVDNAEFAPLIIGSKATGGGAAGAGNGGGATKKLSEMTDAERIAWSNKDPAGFKKAVDADLKANPVSAMW